MIEPAPKGTSFASGAPVPKWVADVNGPIELYFKQPVTVERKADSSVAVHATEQGAVIEIRRTGDGPARVIGAPTALLPVLDLGRSDLFEFSGTAQLA